jgi:hypothetical protein
MAEAIVGILVLSALLARIPLRDGNPKLYYKGTVHAPRVYWHEEGNA